MVCKETALTCAVQALNNTLGAGPTWFEWLGLGIGAATSLATFLVAYRAFRVSQQATRAAERSTEFAERSTQLAEESTKLAELVRADGVRRELLGERQAFAEQFQELFDCWRRLFTSGEDQDLEAMAVVATRLWVVSQSLESPHGPRLVDVIQEYMGETPATDENGRVHLLGAEAMVRRWVQRPDDIADPEPFAKFASNIARGVGGPPSGRRR